MNKIRKSSFPDSGAYESAQIASQFAGIEPVRPKDASQCMRLDIEFRTGDCSLSELGCTTRNNKTLSHATGACLVEWVGVQTDQEVPQIAHDGSRRPDQLANYSTTGPSIIGKPDDTYSY